MPTLIAKSVFLLFPNCKYYDLYKYGTNNSDFSTRGLFDDG